MQIMAVIYLTASPPQSSASSLPRLATVLDAVPEMSLSSPSQGERSPAPGEEFWHVSKGMARFKGGTFVPGCGSAARRAELVLTEPFPCTAQTTAQICSRREGGMWTKQHKPCHGPGFQTKESDPFSRQTGPFITFALSQNSLAEGEASLLRSIRGFLPSLSLL